MKVSFIGGGNMGEAMLAALLKKRLVKPQNITVSDINPVRRQHLQKKYSINTTADNLKALDGADVVILAIKPQNLAEVMAEIGGSLQPRQLVLSIIAGARIKTLRRGLKHQRIVRAMPNTPAQIGEGITVWTTTRQVTEKQNRQACTILGAMGQEIYTNNEKHLDMATAISGSGPAYFFFFAEALTAAAKNLGLPQEIAEKLVRQTMFGAARLLQQSGKAPAELRQMVTSPGGTTAAAIQRFEAGSFTKLVQEAAKAAHKRARELGK